MEENSGNGTSVGLVAASDVDAGDTLDYSITAGNTGGAFAIDNATGEITVANSSQLDFETTPTFNLTVRVEDTGSLTDTATITINLDPLNDNNPVFTSSGTPTVSENTTFVVTVVATDADLPGQSVGYWIVGRAVMIWGNSRSTAPPVTYRSIGAPDFEIPSDVGGDDIYELTVQADDGNGGTSDQNLLVTVTDVNESPSVTGAVFGVVENSVSGTSVGVVIGTDPDAGDVLDYSITAGDTRADVCD